MQYRIHESLYEAYSTKVVYQNNQYKQQENCLILHHTTSKLCKKFQSLLRQYGCVTGSVKVCSADVALSRTYFTTEITLTATDTQHNS